MGKEKYTVCPFCGGPLPCPYCLPPEKYKEQVVVPVVEEKKVTPKKVSIPKKVNAKKKEK